MIYPFFKKAIQQKYHGPISFGGTPASVGCAGVPKRGREQAFAWIKLRVDVGELI